MVVVLAPGDAAAAIELLASHGAPAFEIGSIVERESGGPQTTVV
jgi:phosphoribosylaminoimidazole (AIR) synthetase